MKNDCKTLRPIIDSMTEDADFLEAYAEQVADTAKGFSGHACDSFMTMVARFQRIETSLRGAIEEMENDKVCVCENPLQRFNIGAN